MDDQSNDESSMEDQHNTKPTMENRSYGESSTENQSSAWHIDMVICDNEDDNIWRLTGFYVIGDFNDILDDSEKVGENPQPSSLIEGFKDVVKQSVVKLCGDGGKLFTTNFKRRIDYWANRMELLKNITDPNGCNLFKETQFQHLRAIEHQSDFWKQWVKEF
nr:putative mitochondrial protein [Ipomoea batatas]GMD72671.1 putative mitochondrial protein [Ipomoea batatas]